MTEYAGSNVGPPGPPGQDGEDGQDGAPGADGVDGVDGQDAPTPGPWLTIRSDGDIPFLFAPPPETDIGDSYLDNDAPWAGQCIAGRTNYGNVTFRTNGTVSASDGPTTASLLTLAPEYRPAVDVVFASDGNEFTIRTDGTVVPTDPVESCNSDEVTYFAHDASQPDPVTTADDGDLRVRLEGDIVRFAGRLDISSTFNGGYSPVDFFVLPEELRPGTSIPFFYGYVIVASDGTFTTAFTAFEGGGIAMEGNTYAL